MKQLSSSELNNMSKEELAAMVLQMQQLHEQLQQQQKQMELQQKQMEQQIHTLNEKIAIMNARHFGRSTEKLETLPGQMNIFNETEVAAAEAIAEPAIEQVVVRRKKKKGQRKEDLSRLPKRIENHELTKEQLKAIFGENGWKRLPDEVYSRVEYQPVKSSTRATLVRRFSRTPPLFSHTPFRSRATVDRGAVTPLRPLDQVLSQRAIIFRACS